MPALSSASPRSRRSSGQALEAPPLISVVIPTRDRPRALRRCLEALSLQTVKERLEVVVVDDGSLDADAVADAVSGWPRTRLRRQVPSGPAAARNAGARVARGAFICFTDDDCEPREDWAERLVQALGGEADAVGGRTIGSPSNAITRASELIAHAPGFVSDREDSLIFTPSNNLACRADVLLALPFDDGYPAAAAEDREWCERLLRSGRILRYEPSAVLVHHHDSELRSFLRKQLRYGRGAFAFRRLSGEPRSLERPQFYLQLLRRGFAAGPIAGTLVCIAQLATAAGFAAEWAKARRERRTSAG